VNELETRWRDLGEFIREQRHVGHLSLRKLSEMAGISNPYLSQIERGLRKPSAEILQQIARALEISSETLYIRAGILEPREGDTDLVTEIRRDLWLNEEQKKTLVQIYESFRAERRAAGFDPVLLGLIEPGPVVADELADEVPPSASASPADELDAGDDESDVESEALAGR
jgi:transcriptional regulator with XRE-family HTH domain